MATRRKRGKRKNVLDWWQSVLDETKDFVDDTIDRARDDDDYDDLEDDVDELKQAVAALNAKLDQLLAASPASKPAKDVVLDAPKEKTGS
ncbi:MAG: hypothetical protein ACRD0O_12725 [Acidimicrobiia bacterium]